MSDVKTDDYIRIRREDYFGLVEKVKYFEEKEEDKKDFKIYREILSNVDKVPLIDIEKSEYLITPINTEKIEMLTRTKSISKKENSINWEEIREYTEDKFGVALSDNPTDEEGEMFLEAWINKMNQRADSIISTLTTTLNKLDELK